MKALQKTNTSWTILGLAGGILTLLAASSLYTVNESEQVLILQLGEPKGIHRTPGLKMKIPLIQNIVRLDKRLLDLNIEAAEVIAADQKRLVVDTYVLYKIIDPLKFYQSLGNEKVAETRLSTLASASLRRVLGSHPLASLLSAQRIEIMTQIRQEVHQAASSFGVEIVDVRIQHADLPKENSKAIYERMASERNQEAKEFRAKGAETAQKIQAEADKESTILLAEADKTAYTLHGEGDAGATHILAEAYKRDPGFFTFYRSLEAYKTSMNGQNTTFVISPNTDFFQFFKSPYDRKGKS